jgi:uncharacterized membrane protein YccC
MVAEILNKGTTHPESGIRPDRVRWVELVRKTAPDAEAALFSLKSFAAATIAYYTALRVGLSQPVWAITTAFIVSQPLAGQVLSKAFFRMLGTLLGASAAVILVPAFVNEPVALSFILALWLGLCVYVSLVDHTPRSYVFLLAGYTAGIIGFPSVLTPGNIFNTAVLRVQEIGIGIIAATLVHGVIFPRTVTKRLQQQIMATVASVEQASRRALAGSRDVTLDAERRRLASSNVIEQLAYHLAFDTARLVPQTGVIRALQDQVSWLLPLSGSVEDRIAECRVQLGGLPSEVAALIRRVESWFAESIVGPARDQIAQELVAEAERIEETFGAQVRWEWRDALLASLLARLAELVLAHRLLRDLQDNIFSGGVRPLSLEALRLVGSASGRSLHRDHALAVRSALGSAVSICVVCAFWIATAWPSGAGAALLMGIACALFASSPQPGAGIRRFYAGFVIGVAVAALYGFVVFPRVTEFMMLAAVIAPILLLAGSLLVRPSLAQSALGAVLGFVNTVGLSSTYQSSFPNFINGAIGAIAALGAGVIIVDMFQVVGAETAFARLFRAGFRDIGERAVGGARDTRRWINRMLDRIALIATRSGPSGGHPALPPYDALVGLRVGYLAGELRGFSSSLSEGEQRSAVDELLRELNEHYRSIEPARGAPVGEAVLHAIDRAMASFLVDSQSEKRRQGAILLTGLRRTLFPSAEAFTGAPA